LNAQDSISLIQTAEGALQQVSDILQRMRELGVQAMNGILSQSEKDAISAEMTQLQQEVDRIAETNKFNGTYLLKGTLGMTTSKNDSTIYTLSGGEYSLMSGVSGLDVSGAEKQVEYTLSAASGGKLAMTYSLDGGITTVTANSRFDINTYNSSNPYSGFVGFEDEDGKDIGIKLHLIKMDLSDLNGKTVETSEGGSADLQIGANSTDTPLKISIGDIRSTALGVDNLSIETTDNAKDALDAIDNALTLLNTERGNLGAYQNRLEYTIQSLAASEENLTAAESRIRDVDMAKEMMNYTKANILNQTATAMLSQANQEPQMVLQLLQGL
jgi:flagellin